MGQLHSRVECSRFIIWNFIERLYPSTTPFNIILLHCQQSSALNPE